MGRAKRLWEGNLRPDLYLGSFVWPAETRFFWRKKGRDMPTTKLLTAGRIHSKDRGNTAWVHVAIDAVAFRFPVVLPVVAIAILMTGSASGAQRTATTKDHVITQAVDWYFSTVPGYEKGDLITRSQIEKIIAKLESVG